MLSLIEYSRADWTELQLRFRPPRDSPSVSTRLRDYANPEEIGAAIAAVQLGWRQLNAQARSANRTATHRMSAAAQSRRLHAKGAKPADLPAEQSTRFE